MNSKIIIIGLAIAVVLVVAAAVAFIFLYGRGGISIKDSIFDDTGILKITVAENETQYSFDFVMKTKTKVKKEDLPKKIMGYGSADQTAFYIKTLEEINTSSSSDSVEVGTEIKWTSTVEISQALVFLRTLKTVDKKSKIVYICNRKDDKSKAEFYSFKIEITDKPELAKQAVEATKFEKHAITGDDVPSAFDSHFANGPFFGYAVGGGWLLPLTNIEKHAKGDLYLVPPASPTYYAANGSKAESFILSWNAHFGKKFEYLGQTKDFKIESIEFPPKFVEAQMKIEFDKELEGKTDKDSKIKEFKTVFGVAYHQPAAAAATTGGATTGGAATGGAKGS